jgi:HlyD family secretion protein
MGSLIRARVIAVCAIIGIGKISTLQLDGIANAQTQDADRASGAQVVVVRAANACFSSAVPVTGFLVARREAIVTLSPGDKITEVLAAEGDKVASGQTLAQVTRPSRDVQRIGLEARSETAALKAPASGIVIRSNALVGATASPMQIEPLFRIAVDDEIELEAEIPSIHVPKLSPGQPARVLIKDALELSGRVRLAPSAIDPKTQLGRARISLERSSQLQFATFARAIIDASRSCGLSVPRSAVTYRTGGTNVQVVHDDVIETRSVQIGLHSDTDTEITKGLSAGDLVVANAGTSLRDGDKVKPIDAAVVSGQR